MMTTCENCGELKASTIQRQDLSAMCDRCWSAQLDYGFLHTPEAFTCDICGKQDRTAVTNEHDERVCATCKRERGEA